MKLGLLFKRMGPPLSEPGPMPDATINPGGLISEEHYMI